MEKYGEIQSIILRPFYGFQSVGNQPIFQFGFINFKEGPSAINLVLNHHNFPELLDLIEIPEKDVGKNKPFIFLA